VLYVPAAALDVVAVAATAIVGATGVPLVATAAAECWFSPHAAHARRRAVDVHKGQEARGGAPRGLPDPTPSHWANTGRKTGKINDWYGLQM